MSKDQKPTREELVKIVENLQQLLSYISTTLTFWKLDTIFPGNLIKESCDEFYTKINNIFSIGERLNK